VEARLDLVNHPYVLALDIWDLHQYSQKKARRTRLISCYDNRIGLNTLYQGDIDSNRRAIDDIDWDTLIQGRAILLGDFNAYSSYWNPLTDRRKDANLLEAIIDKFDLILNNESGAITRPNSRDNNSIIDLTFTTTSIRLLNSWLIEEEYTTPSNHELIVFNWLDIELNQLKTPQNQDIIG
jgi:Endonuclease-reverse transcriptase